MLTKLDFSINEVICVDILINYTLLICLIILPNSVYLKEKASIGMLICLIILPNSVYLKEKASIGIE